MCRILLVGVISMYVEMVYFDGGVPESVSHSSSSWGPSCSRTNSSSMTSSSLTILAFVLGVFDREVGGGVVESVRWRRRW
jgi:hypothetical protein